MKWYSFIRSEKGVMVMTQVKIIGVSFKKINDEIKWLEERIVDGRPQLFYVTAYKKGAEWKFIDRHIEEESYSNLEATPERLVIFESVLALEPITV